MNTIVKIGIGAGLVGLLFYGAKAAKQALSSFKFDIVSYGRPTLSEMYLTVPLQIRFTNPTPLPISVDRLIADVYIDKNGEFVPGAQINQPVVIPPGVTTDWVLPKVNLQSIFGGNWLNTTAAISSILSRKKIKIRTDVIAIYKGIELPQQSFTSDIPL